MFDTNAPVTAEIIIGINAEMATSVRITSTANKTPAIGALNAEPIPAETPHANSNILFFCDNLYFCAKLEPNAAPVITIGLSNPAEPPSPTVRELVIICAYICFAGKIPPFFATACNILALPFSIELFKNLLTTKTVSKIPIIGSKLLK